jgi:hypothetical protein
MVACFVLFDPAAPIVGNVAGSVELKNVGQSVTTTWVPSLDQMRVGWLVSSTAARRVAGKTPFLPRFFVAAATQAMGGKCKRVEFCIN